MKFDVLLGLALGGFVAVVSIAGNVRQGDPHRVSMFPDALTLLLAVVLTAGCFLSLRRRSGNRNRADLLWAGMRLSGTTGAVFAITLSAFALWWFPSGSLTLIASLLIAALLGMTSVVGAASVLTGRLIARRI